MKTNTTSYEVLLSLTVADYQPVRAFLNLNACKWTINLT